MQQPIRDDALAVSSATVLLADRHPVTLLGLIHAIEQSPRLTLVATATDGAAATALIQTERPRVAVIDAQLDRYDGREVVRLVGSQGLSTRILVLSDHHPGEVLSPRRTAGAQGYVSKRAPVETVRDAIEQLARGHALPRELSPDVLRADRFVLTDRELEILAHISEGASAPDIAQVLYISVGTVKSHLQNLYAKLGVRDRAAAVAVAMRAGLIR